MRPRIIATDYTIHDIVRRETRIVGNDGDLNHIDTSQVTNMSSLCEDLDNFNCDISKWDTSSVTNMSFMFSGCSSFNQDISKWDTSKVTDMCWMFDGCSSFNQDLSNWDISNVFNMHLMFDDCDKMEDKNKPNLTNNRSKEMKRHYTKRTKDEKVTRLILCVEKLMTKRYVIDGKIKSMNEKIAKIKHGRFNKLIEKLTDDQKQMVAKYIEDRFQQDQ